MPETHELDVDFEVVGTDTNDDEVPVVPRMPNVVSRRGHRVKLIALIHDVPRPDRTTRVSMTAIVNVLQNTLLGRKGDVSRLFQK